MGDPVKLLYDVLAFASRVGGASLFLLLNKHELTKRFVENSLKLYCVNPNRTFLAVSFISQLNPARHLDHEQPKWLLEVPLYNFKSQSSSFRKEIEFKFVHYMHCIDSRIARHQDTPEDKKNLIVSYAQLLNYLGTNFVKKYKMKIFFTIRFLFDYYSKGNMQELKYVCKILEELIRGAETWYIQAELPTICCLILSFGKVISREGLKV